MPSNCMGHSKMRLLPTWTSAFRYMDKLSSPYNPESNGLAEAAVKKMKSLILRRVDRKENLSIAIAAWRNMARADGVSPAQLFYNRRMKPILPAQAENTEIDILASDEAAERAVKIATSALTQGNAQNSNQANASRYKTQLARSGQQQP